MLPYSIESRHLTKQTQHKDSKQVTKDVQFLLAEHTLRGDNVPGS